MSFQGLCIRNIFLEINDIKNKENSISYAQAGAKCGRTATAVRSWAFGTGINDIRVRKRISTIMGTTVDEVTKAVDVYNASIKIINKNSSLTISEFCSKVKPLLTKTVLYDDEREIPVNVQKLIKGLADNFISSLKEIQKFDLK